MFLSDYKSLEIVANIGSYQVKLPDMDSFISHLRGIHSAWVEVASSGNPVCIRAIDYVFNKHGMRLLLEVRFFKVCNDRFNSIASLTEYVDQKFSDMILDEYNWTSEHVSINLKAR